MSNWTFIKDWFDYKEGKRGYLRSYENNLRADENAVYSYGSHFPLAVKCMNGYVLNGDRYSSTTNRHQSITRREARGKFVEIPLSVLYVVNNRSGSIDAAKKVKIVFQREATYKTVKYQDAEGQWQEREEHLLGGCVIEIEGRYFVSGTDEGAPWGRGYFLTELKGKPVSFEHAFSLLTPEVVKRAKKSKKEVLRQGEWFFIPVGDTRKLKKKYWRGSKLAVEKMVLLPVQPTPEGMPERQKHHKVSECVWGMFGYSPETSPCVVRGFVRHTAGDHKRLKLGNGKDWYQAAHNLQVMSWSASGRRVD